MKILFVQTGDYAEAFQRLERGGEEIYHEQYRSVSFVRDLCRDREVIVAAISEVPGEVVIADGLTAVGIPAKRFFNPSLGPELDARYLPDALIARLPHHGVINAAVARGIPVFPCLADVFAPIRPAELITRQGYRNWRMNRRMRSVLANPNVVAVGNHSKSASQSIVDVLGLSPSRVTPWEWSRLPVAPKAKLHPGNERPLRLFFVGAVSEDKGAGDLLSAFVTLQAERPGQFHLTMAGAGPLLDRAVSLSQQAAMVGSLDIKGLIPKREVRELMSESDVVVVPSRPTYAEGLPNAVVEGLAFRAPLVVAEHPSIAGRLKHGRDCLIAKALDPIDLAAKLKLLQDNKMLFEEVSENAASAYESLFFGSSWYELIKAFVDDPRNHTDWVAKHSLAALS